MIVLVFVPSLMVVLYFCVVCYAPVYVDLATALYPTYLHSTQHSYCILLFYWKVYTIYVTWYTTHTTYLCMAIVLFVACILVLRVLCIVSPSYMMLCIYAWLFSLLLSCKRLFHAHHTQLFFAKIHTRIVCKNEALLCCSLYISTVYIVIYDIVLFLFLHYCQKSRYKMLLTTTIYFSACCFGWKGRRVINTTLYCQNVTCSVVVSRFSLLMLHVFFLFAHKTNKTDVIWV